MKNNPYYPIVVVSAHQYAVVSTGKRPIKKVAEFTHTGRGKIVNMAFGDLMPDGSIDDTVNSNNGDLVMVLATTIEILKMYTVRFPDAEIFFTGSTKARTQLYNRTKEEDEYIEKPYTPQAYATFTGFIIRRIS